MRVPPAGSPLAEIVVVGEAPGRQEVEQGRPFVGAAGQLLNKLLYEVGLDRSALYITNVSKRRPPNNDISHFFESSKVRARQLGLQEISGKYPKTEMLQELEALRKEFEQLKNAKVIIALGATALWALTGETKIGDWRGSIIITDKYKSPIGLDNKVVIPTYHPAGILRQMEWYPIARRDLQRAVAYWRGEITRPEYTFHIRPTAAEAIEFLQSIEPMQPVAIDIETIDHEIAAIGVGVDEEEAMCIPLIVNGSSYYSEDEEFAIVREMRRVLREAYCIGQNFAYDAQYFARDFLVYPEYVFDTMVAHHVVFAGLPKSLDFLSSLYLDWHEFWKHELKESRKVNDWEQFWTYNCKDVVITYRLFQVLSESLKKAGLDRIFDFQMRLWHHVLRMQMRGLRVDKEYREKLRKEIQDEIARLEKRLHYIVGYPLNPRSTKQMKTFLIDELGLKPVQHRKTGRTSFGREALPKYAEQQPLLIPIVEIIERTRRLQTLLSTYVEAELDPDGRLRTSLDITGTETYRFASRANVWGRGGNMQNVPRPSEDLPNIRDLFVPDEGYILVDMDLDRADAQVVAWEADDEELKQAFREGVDIHSENAKVLGCSRTMAKQAVHATNYGVGPRTMASILGITVREAEMFRKRWFEAHPKIKEWHYRVEMQLNKTRMVRNKFGYRKVFFGRLEGSLPEAIAWIPQSTVACVINRALVKIAEALSEDDVQILLQVHDSLVLQVREDKVDELLPRIKKLAEIVVPYDDPLIIPVSFKVSKGGWGSAEEV